MKAILILLLFLTPFTATFAQEDTIQYSVAFPIDSGIYIASLKSDNTWDVKRTENGVFSQVDVWNLTPAFSPDGKRLYLTVPTEGYNPEEVTMYADLYTYDVELGAFDHFMQVFDPAALNEFTAEAIYLRDISPDGRYGLAIELFSPYSYLINLETKTILYENPCWSDVLQWTETQVILNQTINFACETGMVYAVDLSSGELIYTLPHDSDISPLQPPYRLQNGDLLLVQGYPAQLFYLKPGESLDVLAEMDSRTFAVSDSERFVAFKSGRLLIRLDLTAREQIVLDAAFNGDGLQFEGDTLSAWNIVDDVLSYVTYAPDGSRTIQEIYSGPISDFYDAEGDVFVFEAEENHLLAYGLNGLIFDSADYPGYTVSLYPVWENDWMHFYAAKDGVPTTLSVRISTGEVRFAPEPGYRYATTSPDGAWWLYIGHFENESDYMVENVLAYHVESGDIVPLLENGHFRYNFHFSPGEHFVWSA